MSYLAKAQDAPSPNLRYPSNAKITAAELLTFLPQCLRSADVIYRFVSNGATRGAICKIIATNRDPNDRSLKWNADSCGRTMCMTMQKAGFEKWSMQRHDEWHIANIADWDEGDIGVRGFKTPKEYNKKGSSGSILFRDLAKGVQKFPSDSDALDLTRMIDYACKHERVKWNYPEEYDALLMKIGGPKQVTEDHLDRALFNRWDKKVHTEARSRTMTLARARAPDRSSLTSDAASSFPTTGPKADADDDSPSGRKRKLLPAQIQRQNYVRDNPQARQSDEQDLAGSILRDRSPSHPDFEEYIRGKPIFNPPEQSDEVPTDDALKMKFEHPRDSIFQDVYDTYAFAVPWESPPYRPLYRIKGPAKNDVGWWAENIRWAAEQYEMFAITGWNETMEHMKEIEKHRFEQPWVSDEWLEDYEKRRADAKKKQGEMEKK
ncbi:hypothetical protein B0J11DRAFT_483896 [Dendryphion nanum]|uniref:Uncharacterized protein n=1 Tax=Dendryphion nanum TaxID=256645 RepID=A0A9P9IPG8_9PLEO|nr:hypothetical protein B0J11DRAFT_483896 [Dendryphion nanum]